MGISSINGAPTRDIPPRGKGRVVVFSGRAEGGATNAVTLQADESSTGLSIAYAGSLGQYTITLPGLGGCKIGAVSAAFEGASAKACKVESRSDLARTVTLTVIDGTHADVTLAASEFLNFSIRVLTV